MVAVGPPTWGLVGSLLKLVKPQRTAFRRVGPLAVDQARNRLVKLFLESAEEWLLMVDADAALHPATLVRLLSWGRPLVGALAFSRYGPCFPTVYRGRPADRQGFVIQIDEVRAWLQTHPELVTSEPMVLEPRPEDALTRVDVTGCHCLLIHREVLESMPQPWFLGREDAEHGGGAPDGSGEDFYFCEKAADCGWEVFVDRSCMAAHAYGDERVLAGLDFLVWDYASEYAADGGN